MSAEHRSEAAISPLIAWEHSLRLGRGRWQSASGSSGELPVADWRAEPDAGDHRLLDRCGGPTLDVGCGPGRMVGRLARDGLPALGIDVSRLAVTMTRERGAAALRRDVFALGVGAGRWHHILLADGNIGIGGDPVRILRRCRELLAPDGTVLVDLAAPGLGLRQDRVRMIGAHGSSAWFGWAWLGVDALEGVAARAGLEIKELWRVPLRKDRWQAELVVRRDEPSAARTTPA